MAKAKPKNIRTSPSGKAPWFCVEVDDSEFAFGRVSGMMSEAKARTLFADFVKRGHFVRLYRCVRIKSSKKVGLK